MSKDMALNVTACGELMYPLTEKAVAIVNPSGVPFSRAVVGTTMPSANYRIKRDACGFSVFEYVIEGEGKLLIDGEWQTAKGLDECDSIKRRLLSLVYKKPSLDGIAGEFHMSKSNLIRTFKKRYGVTPYEYVLRLKTEAAKALLRHSDLSVKVISERLCFSDEHYFSTLFFSRVGKRPVEYRKG